MLLEQEHHFIRSIQNINMFSKLRNAYEIVLGICSSKISFMA